MMSIYTTEANTIAEIIERKIDGQDNTEKESAFIKSYVKDLLRWFPLEFNEALDELDIINGAV